MTIDKLKPCPFCGGKAAVIKHTFIGYGEDYYQPVCLDCNASKADYRYRTEEDAINAWNRRAIEAEPTKYRWHDLRKDQYDLPIYEKPYLCVIDTMGDKYRIMGRYQILNLKEFVIAWREIEPFDEEET